MDWSRVGPVRCVHAYLFSSALVDVLRMNEAAAHRRKLHPLPELDWAARRRGHENLMGRSRLIGTS